MLKMITHLYIPTLFGVSVVVYFILLVIGVLTFFIWGKITKKLIKIEKTRKIITWIGTIVATPLIYIGLIILWYCIICYHPTRRFDKQKWFTEKEIRHELSEDIIDSKMLIGKTKSEVEQILGDGDITGNSEHWGYYLGLRQSFTGIDPEFLDIEFKDGKVIKVTQIGH